MSSSKSKKKKKTHSKKEKQLIKLINNSDSESECSEHELSYYLNDRVKLMKEVLKIIKPKKIKSMAPDCIKNVDNEEINSMLLEELLGISNKRLRYIFNGQNLEEDSSSTDPEEEQQQQPIDIISLDDISDDDFIDLDSDATSDKKGKKKRSKIKVKEEPKKKKIKKEKQDKSAKDKSSKKSKEADTDKTGQENLMSVLELLELQARARAIRSQLALENSKKAQEKENTIKIEESDHEDAVIIESPKNIEIVITSSESETEDLRKNNTEPCVVQNVAEETSKENNIENSKGSGENSNQPVIESSDENFNEGETLESQVGELDGETNNKDEGVISEDKDIGSISQPNLITEENKSENMLENREGARTEKEETDSSKKQLEKVNVDENISEMESMIKPSNTKEDALIKGTISPEIFIVDSGSECDKALHKNTRRKHKKCKKSRLERSKDGLEIDKKVKTKSRKEGCKHKTMNAADKEVEVVRVSKNERELKIKSETMEKEQIQAKSVEVPIHRKNNKQDEGDGIVINMDPSEIDCIISD